MRRPEEVDRLDILAPEARIERGEASRGVSMVATTRMRPPQRGQANTSIPNVCRIRSGHDHLRAAGGRGASTLYLCTTAQAYPRVTAWNTSVALAAETVTALVDDIGACVVAR